MAEYKRQCAICGDEFIATNYRVTVCPKDHYLICPVCGKQYIHNSTVKRSGCSRSCSAKASMDKKRATNLEKYGSEYATQSKQVKEKTKQTCMKRYGVKNPMSDKTIAKKSRGARKTSYEEVFEKTKKTWMERYGVDNPSKSPEVIDKITQTFISRYGVKRAMSVPEFRKKFEQTMIEHHGVPYYTQTDAYRNNEFFRISKTNQEFAKLLDKYEIQYEMEFSIEKKSYDFYLTNLNILIEINPTYTHNVIGNHWNTNGISENYHLVKTQLAEKYGFRCIHVFDWDDWDAIIQSLDYNIKIFARNCIIKEISQKEAKKFTDKYHLQKSCRGQNICIGLFYLDELVEVMTFGKPRYNRNYEWELLRLCTKTGYKIVGGASKLFKYAITHFELNSIISYCNYSKFNGKVYETIGMRFTKVTQPQEIWSKEHQNITANLLRSKGYDKLFGTNYGKGTNNELLMLEHGWLPVYDCGQKVYTWTRT